MILQNNIKKKDLQGLLKQHGHVVDYPRSDQYFSSKRSMHPNKSSRCPGTLSYGTETVECNLVSHWKGKKVVRSPKQIFKHTQTEKGYKKHNLSSRKKWVIKNRFMLLLELFAIYYYYYYY